MHYTAKYETIHATHSLAKRLFVMHTVSFYWQFRRDFTFLICVLAFIFLFIFFLNPFLLKTHFSSQIPIFSFIPTPSETHSVKPTLISRETLFFLFIVATKLYLSSPQSQNSPFPYHYLDESSSSQCSRNTSSFSHCRRNVLFSP